MLFFILKYLATMTGRIAIMKETVIELWIMDSIFSTTFSKTYTIECWCWNR